MKSRWEACENLTPSGAVKGVRELPVPSQEYSDELLITAIGSEFDTSEEAEGGVDPLGLPPAYERLGDRASRCRRSQGRAPCDCNGGGYVGLPRLGSDVVAADTAVPVGLILVIESA
jgi:hypothetical protein